MNKLSSSKSIFDTQEKIFTLNKVVVAILLSSIPAVSFAQSQPESDETIVVIGEKNERSIYDTSSSVFIYDENTLKSLPNAVDWNDIAKLTPNITDTGPGNSLPTVRGVDGSGPSIGSLASFAGTNTRLNISLDGRSLSYTELAFGHRSLWDVQQAEVYVGPQSYIQGQNSSAGSIVIKSNDPTFDFETAAKTSIGEQGYSQNAAMISAPIVDNQLAFRLSVDQQERESVIPLAANKQTGDARQVSSTTSRAKLLYVPEGINGLSSLLTITHMDTRGPQNEASIGTRYTEDRPVYTTTTRTAMWNLNWKFNDQLTWENSIGHTSLDFDRAVKDDTQKYLGDWTEKQAETILKYNLWDSKVSGIFGGRYYFNDQIESFEMGNFYPISGEVGSHSVFFESDIKIANSVIFNLGTRYQRENRKRKANFATPLDYDNTDSVFLPKIGITYKSSPTNALGLKIAKGFNSAAAGISLHKTLPAISYEFDTEYVWNYELFSRIGFNDGLGVFSTNFFFNDYDGLQIGQANDAGYSVIQNLDSAETFGLEVGSTYLVTDDLEVFANLGWLETSYTETVAQGGAEKELPRATDFTTAVGFNYFLTEEISTTLSANYNNGYYSDLNNSEDTYVDSYVSADAKVSYEFEHGQLSVFATNVFDSNEPTYYPDGLTGGHISQQPRLIGASLELIF